MHPDNNDHRVKPITMLPNSDFHASSRPKPGKPPSACSMYCLPF